MNNYQKSAIGKIILPKGKSITIQIGDETVIISNRLPLPNKEQNLEECDATAAQSSEEPLAQKNPLEDITECYVPVSEGEAMEMLFSGFYHVEVDLFKSQHLGWLKKITLPSPAVSDNSEITPKQENASPAVGGMSDEK